MNFLKFLPSKSNFLRYLVVFTIVGSLYFNDKIINIIDYNKQVWRLDVISLPKLAKLKQCFDMKECRQHKPLKLLFLNSILGLKPNLSSNADIFEAVTDSNHTCLTIWNIYDEMDVHGFDDFQNYRNNLVVIDHTADKSNKRKIRSVNECVLYASYNAEFSDKSDLNLDFSILSLNHLNLEDLITSKKISFFLTFERQYLLTYHESKNANIYFYFNKEQLIELQDDLVNRSDILLDLSCTSDEFVSKSLCFETDQRELILLNSTFTLILNREDEWSVEDTTRLIESISVGTIPVLLDPNVKLPLCDNVAWNEIVVRIPHLDYLNSILSSFNQADIIARRIRAYNVFKAYFADETSQFLTMLTLIRYRLNIQAMGFEASYGTVYKPNFETIRNETFQINVTDAVKNVFKDSSGYMGMLYEAFQFYSVHAWKLCF
jgi:hypothetical protein